MYIMFALETSPFNSLSHSGESFSLDTAMWIYIIIYWASVWRDGSLEVAVNAG